MADVTPATFRADFPEFADQTKYPDPLVQFWLNLAYNLMRPASCRWGDILSQGVELYVAHNLSLQGQNQKQGTSGGAPGTGVGALSSKSVGSVSAGYDVAAGTVKDGGNFNLTNYGTRFLNLVNMIGAGPIQITGPNINWPPAVFPPIP
jgi:hypothetical protein